MYEYNDCLGVPILLEGRDILQINFKNSDFTCLILTTTFRGHLGFYSTTMEDFMHR